MGDVTAVGDEGGFAPNKLTSDEEAIEKILEAVKCGFEPERFYDCYGCSFFRMEIGKRNWLL